MKKFHKGLLFTTSNKIIWAKIFLFSCMGKKVAFWQFLSKADMALINL
jgi:hypothetical protein